MPLASRESLYTYLGLNSGTSTSGAELDRLLAMALATVEQYIERKLARGSRTEVRSGNGSDLLLLRDAPIASVASLTIGTTAIAASSAGSDGYLFDGEALYLVGSQCFTRGRKNVTVVYDAGYTENPADLEHAMIEIAAQAYREKDWIGFQSKSLAGETVAFLRNALPDSAKTALMPYRRTYPCD